MPADIPERDRQLYRDVALAHRKARHAGAHPNHCNFMAIAEVQKHKPWLRRGEAEATAVKIIKYVSERWPEWFWR